MLYLPQKIHTLLTVALPLLDWRLWAGPAFFVSLGLITGLIVEKILLGTIRKVLGQTASTLNGHLSELVRGMIRWIFGLWGVYAATFNMPFLPEGNLEMIRRIVFVMSMLIAIRLLAQVAVALVRFYLTHAKIMRALPDTSIFENLIRFAVYAFGGIMLLQTLGISVVPLITALGVGGLAISLALQDTLANLFAGIQMILARQIRVGNTIQLENGLSGKVEDIGWRTTTLKQLSGNLVILPNSKMASNIIVNYNNPHPELTLSLQIAIPLGVDLEKAEQIAMHAAQTVGDQLLAEKPGLSKKQSECKPLVRFVSYGDSWINMSVQLPFLVPMDGGLVRHELFKALHTSMLAEKVTLPFPQQVLHLDWAEGQALESRARKTESA